MPKTNRQEQQLMIPCKGCKKDIEIRLRGQGTRLYCNLECKLKSKKQTKGGYSKKVYMKKEECILYLLKGQDANMGMICAFAKTNPRSARQMITNLRKKGINISLNGGFTYDINPDGTRNYANEGMYSLVLPRC